MRIYISGTSCAGVSPRSQNFAIQLGVQQGRLKTKTLLIALLGFFALPQTAISLADTANGKALYSQRCAVCHGADIKGTGPLARKSNPPTPDLTTAAFKKRLSDYPGVIVSSVILRPNGDLIPKTLRENGVKIPPHAWSVNDFRDLHQYMSGVISHTNR
ncbi:c-type cytochrome [Pseudomonas sp. RIT778]|uniref:c-type cytochrome n=1 Tax=Pseudomonas sp. RIT778 TaxID=2870471 RepID=UPI0039083072